MLQKFYKLLVEPSSNDIDQRNRELVLNWLLVGIASLLVVYSANTLIGVVFLDKSYLFIRFLWITVILGALVSYLLLLRKRERLQRIMSALFVSLLFMSTFFIVFEWGIINPIGILLFGLVTVVAGILLGARYSLYVALVICATLALLEYGRSHHLVTPDTSWSNDPSSMTDVVNLGAVFFIIALVSWLFNKQMEQSLHRARHSEKALQKERDLLEIKVEERTRALQEAQLEKVQQVYRFAELGHLSTALFHDLAGSLSSLSIDIESLRKKGKTDFTKRIDNNIHYIDSVVQRVKSQIQGKDNLESFDVLAETKDLVGILSFNARKARTHIELQADKNKPIVFTGNLTRFRQLIINLLSNAIEAYPPSNSIPAKERPVIIRLTSEEGTLTIQVTDRGKGIQKAAQSKIFDPFFTTKSSGSGIGLFIVRQVAENDFNGTIKLTSSKKTGTTFTVIIPK